MLKSIQEATFIDNDIKKAPLINLNNVYSVMPINSPDKTSNKTSDNSVEPKFKLFQVPFYTQCNSESF